MENATKEKIKKIANICINVLIWICVAISFFVTVLVFSAQGSEDGVPAIFGKSLITIESPSMKPTYGMNDIVFMTKLDDAGKAELKAGDIITYHAPIDINGDGIIGDINTHRIHKIDHSTGVIETIGDNNLIPDSESTENPYKINVNDVIGQCTENGKLVGIGGVIKFLRSSLGFFLCIVLPMILFFLYELYRFIAILLAEKNRKAKEQVIEAEEDIKKRAIEEYLAQQAAAAAATAAPAVETAPAEETAPVEETAPTEDTAPAEETAPVEETAPTEETVPTEDTASESEA